MPTLTDKHAAGAKPPARGRRELWDALVPGLGLRITATGARSWVVMYRAGRRKRRLTLGTYPTLSLAAARDLARKTRRQVAAGQDPAAAKREARDAESVEALVERFLDTYLRPKRRPAYVRETERLLRREVLRTWGRRKAREITRRDVKALLADIAARPAPITANRTKAALSKFFNWCVDEEVLDASPALRVPAPGEEHERERVLTSEEIRRLWQACDAVDADGDRLVTPMMAAFFRLRLLTAQRGGEVAGMRWDEIDEASEWWQIPAERSKNRKAHRVYLSHQARAILDGLPRVGPFVFPSPRPGQPIRSGKRAWAALVEAAQLQDAVPHDLRRTAATGLGSLGVPRLIIKQVLNHTEPGVTKIYDRYTYDAEKRDALTRWGAHVRKLVAGEPTGATVIAIETAGRRA